MVPSVVHDSDTCPDGSDHGLLKALASFPLLPLSKDGFASINVNFLDFLSQLQIYSSWCVSLAFSLQF